MSKETNAGYLRSCPVIVVSMRAAAGLNRRAMWKGRFAKDTSSLVQQFGRPIARARMNAGLLTADE